LEIVLNAAQPRVNADSPSAPVCGAKIAVNGYGEIVLACHVGEQVTLLLGGKMKKEHCMQKNISLSAFAMLMIVRSALW